MDYEKKYNEAFEKARKAYNSISPENYGARRIIEDAFPELRESEDERIRKWILEKVQGYADSGIPCSDEIQMANKALAYLEKQKENPKSCDSIPSDCVSDAKCEDRWYKVKDSLPNSAREVLCKDAIGNFFIGRYYKSTQSWEVVMYDDCDKDNEDNPPIVKWCEIPSEKQKEQKPSTPKYRVGDVMRTKQESAEGITDGLPVIVSVDDNYYYCTNEKIPISEQEEYEFPPMNMRQKPANEQFPPLEGLDAIKAKYYDDGFKNGFDEGVESVKPAEWSEEDRLHYANILGALEYVKGCKSDYNKIEAIISDIVWFKSLRPQPKQEWSEEDEKMKESIIKALYGGGHFAYESEIIWLNFLSLNRKKMNEDVAKLCSNEWSEEDEKVLNELITIMDGGKVTSGTYLSEYVAWLKSLRPQPHKEIYQAAKHDLAIKFMNYLDENRPEGKMGLSNSECKDIDKAFKENDWAKIMRYVEKYSPS